MTDNTLMPFGEHKGKPLNDVPADYLLFLLYEGKCSGELKEYILHNQQALEYETGNRRGVKIKKLG